MVWKGRILLFKSRVFNSMVEIHKPLLLNCVKGTIFLYNELTCMPIHSVEIAGFFTHCAVSLHCSLPATCLFSSVTCSAGFRVLINIANSVVNNCTVSSWPEVASVTTWRNHLKNHKAEKYLTAVSNCTEQGLNLPDYAWGKTRWNS